MIHQTADFDLHPGDGWYSAQCTCGFTEGPFPDIETMVDALMEHVDLADVPQPEHEHDPDKCDECMAMVEEALRD